MEAAKAEAMEAEAMEAAAVAQAVVVKDHIPKAVEVVVAARAMESHKNLLMYLKSNQEVSN